MSYLTQMAGLAWHNFMSAAVGIGIALALARGITYRLQAGAAKTLGNFWVDLVRATVYVLIPISIPVALLLVSQGVIQNFSSYVEITTLEGVKQTLAMGPVASQEIIKEFGTNGGGFFNANSAHPFESPTPLTNFIEMLLIFSIPAAMTYTYGRMARDQKQGWALFAAMALIFFVGVIGCLLQRSARQSGHARHGGGSRRRQLGRERSRVSASPTPRCLPRSPPATSCGAVNSMHDSFTAARRPCAARQHSTRRTGLRRRRCGTLRHADLCHLVSFHRRADGRPHAGISRQKDRIAGDQARDALRADFSAVDPLLRRLVAGRAVRRVILNNAGPHGLSEILYAYSSAAGNNGSAFAGLNANTPWFNVSLGLTMLAGRFLMIMPAMAVAGSLVGKKAVPESLGTFPTNGALFVVLLVGVIIIVGALTFFPALALGPIVEHFLAQAGKVY